MDKKVIDEKESRREKLALISDVRVFYYKEKINNSEEKFKNCKDYMNGEEVSQVRVYLYSESKKKHYDLNGQEFDIEDKLCSRLLEEKKEDNYCIPKELECVQNKIMEITKKTVEILSLGYFVCWN